MDVVYLSWAIALAIPIGAWLIGWLVRKLLFGRLGSLFAKTDSQIDDIIFKATRRHVLLWFVLVGIVCGTRVAPLHDRLILIVDRAAISLFIISISLVASRVAVQIINYYAAVRDAAATTTGLTQGLVKGVILLLGALMMLSSLGISIGPLLGALGVGSLAVALALQPTLSNLVAGTLITATKTVRHGDYIELETGHAGFVVDIGWRQTQIREAANNLVLIPNSKLADSIVRNYTLPQPEQALTVRVGVAYGSDLAAVERVAADTARAVLGEVEGGIRDYEPLVRFEGFGASAITVSVVLRVRDFADRALVTHEFIKRVHARFRDAGIEIPLPQTDVRFRNALPARE